MWINFLTKHKDERLSSVKMISFPLTKWAWNSPTKTKKPSSSGRKSDVERKYRYRINCLKISSKIPPRKLFKKIEHSNHLPFINEKKRNVWISCAILIPLFPNSNHTLTPKSYEIVSFLSRKAYPTVWGWEDSRLLMKLILLYWNWGK